MTKKVLNISNILIVLFFRFRSKGTGKSRTACRNVSSRTRVWSSWLEDKLYAICNNFNILNLFIFHLKISFSVERNNYYTCMEKYFIAVVFKMFLSDANVLSWCCILSFRYLFNDRNLHFNARLTQLGSGLF